uniref:NADH-ubiquinone oxidoreductase chain 2 n=1 Tax=Plesiops nakaharae TaxID=270570 RepID=A0A1V1FLT6_9TELE|nr:NADH dehydrogenase subunit 2 [Plesiops nakaharae]BAX03826.1 NADH dehydrogenase subunit 2 [Plesiops nakaharae]BBU25879.1 NADH dehydrogenase subunit 2 [Plesiops nakaharae]
MSPALCSIFLFSLGLGTMIVFTNSHWFLAWIGLEINTLAIIPIMVQLHQHHPRAVEAANKYFFTQIAGAAMLLIAATVNAWNTGQWAISQPCSQSMASLTVLALGLKLGLAPLHLWMPEVLQGVSFKTGLIISTWQKIAPLILILQMEFNAPHLLIIMGVLSIIIGGLGALNHNHLRKILAYSSTAHLGWMIIVMQFSKSLTLLALVTYIIMTSGAFLLFDSMKAKSINTIMMYLPTNPSFFIVTFAILMSLSGFPPLTGFITKWIILDELIKQQLLALAMVAALSALLSAFFYFRLAYVMALTLPPNTTYTQTSWRATSLSNLAMPLAVTTSLTMTLLPLMPALAALMSI